MSSATTHQERLSPRPSRLIAEALVNRHNEQQVKREASAMGLPADLIDTVVTVCCRYVSHEDDRRSVSKS